jgi:putative MATE family efflux protein
MKETLELGTKPVGTLLIRYSIPAIIAMLVNAIYNIVDRIFIGRLVGENALAGLTIAFPIMMIIFAFCGLIGIGGAALLSIKLGEKKYHEANRVFANTLFMGFIITATILILFFINIEAILKIFGADIDTLGYSKTYMQIILGGFIFQMLSFIFSNFVRTEGKPRLSMMVMLVAAIMNIILDYVFIGLMGLGVAGAAYGTIIGQFSGLMIYLVYYFSKKSIIRVSLRDFILDLSIAKSILSIGAATFLSTLGTSFSLTLLNRGLLEYGGTAAVTSIGAINSLYTFFVMPIIGITQGMQPIIGYNYGARNYSRVFETLKKAMWIGFIFSTIVFIFMELFATFFVGLFLETGSETIPMAAYGLRIFILMLPVLTISFMGTAFHQSIARGNMSMFLGLLRQFIFFIPLVIVLPKVWGLTGIWIVTPIADGLAVAVTVIALLKTYRSMMHEYKGDTNHEEATQTI